MDKFFSQRYCDRCKKELKHGRIMSMFNKDCICMDCADKEKLDKDFDKAANADQEEIQKGNFNFEGIDKERRSTMNRAFFTRKAIDIDELKRRTGLERDKKNFVVETVVELSEEEYIVFSNDLLADYGFIVNYIEKMYVDSNRIWHCMLVKAKGSNDGILVEAEGYSYCRYGSYISNCEEVL